MDMRFYQDLLLEEELLEEKSLFVQQEIKAPNEGPIQIQEELLITQEKIKVQKEEEPTMAQEEANEENGIFLEI